MLEKELEAKLRDAVKQQGGRAYKFTSPGNTGVPDRLVVFPEGKIGFIELKQPGKKPTKNQMLQMTRLAVMDCRVYLLDRYSDIKFILEDIQTEMWPDYRWRGRERNDL